MLAVTTRNRLRAPHLCLPMLYVRFLISRQLSQTPGLIRYAGGIASPTEFLTLTVWTEAAAAQELRRDERPRGVVNQDELDLRAQPRHPGAHRFLPVGSAEAHYSSGRQRARFEQGSNAIAVRWTHDHDELGDLRDCGDGIEHPGERRPPRKLGQRLVEPLHPATAACRRDDRAAPHAACPDRLAWAKTIRPAAVCRVRVTVTLISCPTYGWPASMTTIVPSSR